VIRRKLCFLGRHPEGSARHYCSLLSSFIFYYTASLSLPTVLSLLLLSSSSSVFVVIVVDGDDYDYVAAVVF